MIALHKKEAPDTDLQAEQYLVLMNQMEQAGYDHYEISSFSLPGMQSRHNRSYWQGKKYFGFGPSAHSFDGRSRKWNIAHNIDYIKSISDNKIPFESEILSPVQHLNEYIMTSLRTSEGISLDEIRIKWGEDIASTIEQLAKPYIQSQRMAIFKDHLVLSSEGKLFADGIASALFLDEN
jgi:oxygen-independent coproporphyrinogen-3 oxidase